MTRPRKDHLPVPGRPPKDASRAHARLAAANRVNGACWPAKLAKKIESQILADAGELSAGGRRLAEIIANEYVSIFLAQQGRLKRIERATSPVRIRRRGRGQDGLAELRRAWEHAGEPERASFLEARALELQALQPDSDKWLLWRIGVFERVVSKLGVRPQRIEKALTTCSRCGAGFTELALYTVHVSQCSARSNGTHGPQNTTTTHAATATQPEVSGAAAPVSATEGDA